MPLGYNYSGRGGKGKLGRTAKNLFLITKNSGSQV
jgi:hypothetical protein